MKFDLETSVKIVLIGAGGTGAYIAPHLYRIAYALNRNIRIIIADGDIVEQKNLIRQNFIQSDIGKNKAKVIAERYSEAFGIKTEYVPYFIEKNKTLAELLTPERSYPPELTILIGAVDNDRSRKLCHNVFCKTTDIVYIDSGNGEYTGQVVCGVRKNRKTAFKPIGSVYPEVLKGYDLFPTEQSCAERSVSAPQSISANLFASTSVISILYQILAVGELQIESLTFSSRLMNMKSNIRREKEK